MAVLSKVRSALCAASQIPGEGPTDVEDAPAPAPKSKSDDNDDDIFEWPLKTGFTVPTKSFLLHGDLFWLYLDEYPHYLFVAGWGERVRKKEKCHLHILLSLLRVVFDIFTGRDEEANF